jgi:HD-like signal output (HDOD) protein
MIATTISRDALLHVVRTLPAAPQILAQLGHLLLDVNSDLSDITALLKRDAALTTRIIRISNSAIYNTGKPFASLEDALARVGFTEVYRLTGFAAAAQLADQKLSFYGVTGAQLRENALLTALIMEKLADAADIDARMAYTAGLLRSTGKIAIDRLAKGGAAGAGFEAGRHDTLTEWEMAYLGLTNVEACGTILSEWRFPVDTVEATRDHYLTRASKFPLTNLLNLAAGSAERSSYGLPGETRYWDVTPEKLGYAGVDQPQLDEAVARALENFHALRSAVA